MFAEAKVRQSGQETGNISTLNPIKVCDSYPFEINEIRRLCGSRGCNSGVAAPEMGSPIRKNRDAKIQAAFSE